MGSALQPHWAPVHLREVSVTEGLLGGGRLAQEKYSHKVAAVVRLVCPALPGGTP